MGSPHWHVKMCDKGSDTLGCGSNHCKWLASWKTLRSEESQTLPSGTKPRASQHRSPGGHRWAQSQGHHTIDHLEERGGHKATGITPPIKWRGEAGTKPRTSHHRSTGGKRQAHSQGHHSTDHLEDTGGHKTKDITTSITWRREAGTKPRTSHHRSPGGERRAQGQGHHTLSLIHI